MQESRIFTGAPVTRLDVNPHDAQQCVVSFSQGPPALLSFRDDSKRILPCIPPGATGPMVDIWSWGPGCGSGAYPVAQLQLACSSCIQLNWDARLGLPRHADTSPTHPQLRVGWQMTAVWPALAARSPCPA